MAILPVGIGPQEGGYQIERSLRFNDDDSAYLNRTPASAGNRKTFTWSGWAKRSQATDANGDMLFSGRIDDNNRDSFGFASGIIQVFNVSSGSVTTQFDTTPVFRDSSAWYHVVFSVDTTQATEANRFKIYVNGSQITQFSTANYPSQNEDFFFNSTGINYIGVYGFSTLGGYFDGYLTEINFIDGSALDPTSFGEFNEDTGVWQPKAYTGSYGTNGFYLNFSDNSGVTSTTLGADSSGNGNNWTPNNFSVTAGAGNDSLVDTPTNYGTDTGVGGEVRGNYATLNPLDVRSGTFSNGNLNGTASAGDNGENVLVATIAMTSGKWYCEVLVGSGGAHMIGIADSSKALSTRSWQGANGWYYHINGQKYNAGSGTAYGATYTANDIIGVAYDADAGSLSFYKNGASQGVAFNSGLVGKPMVFALGSGTNSFAQVFDCNYGQRPFAYTAPSGFKALCTQNLPEPTIVDGGEYFNTVLYTGNGSTQSVTGVGFQPDWVWIKERSGTSFNTVFDVLRGTNKNLYTNTTDDEETYVNTLTAFNSDGFSLGSAGWVNTNTSTYVGWNWKANGAGVSNTAGTITSTVSANTDSGFSIVTWAGSAGGTVGHGLGVEPHFIIVKSRTDGVAPWVVYTKTTGKNVFLELNSTNAQNSSFSNYWGTGGVTSSVFGTYATAGYANNVGDLVAYCFAAIPGYSAFGSYTGNGSSDGVFVYTGFRPRFVMVKRSSAAGDPWQINDTARNPSNLANLALHPNVSDAEYTYGSAVMDILSNGFKLRGSDAYVNASGSTYIYMAFAESPFRYSLAR